MPRRFPRISNFPSGLWRASLLGGITRNPTSPTENNIRVHLLPVEAGSESPRKNDGANTPQTRVEEITVGSLPFVYAGSFWKDRRFVEPRQDQYQCVKFELNVLDSTTRVVRLDSPFLINDDLHARLPLQKLLPALNGDSLHDWHQSYWLGVDVGAQKSKLLIPITELARFYYFNSTAFAQALFSQDFKNLLERYDKKTQLVNGRKVFVMSSLPEGFTVDDLWTFARLVLHGGARRCAISVWEDLATQFASPGFSGTAFLGAGKRIKLPFTGKTTLTANGRWVKSELQSWHFLVMWLSSCTYPMPYDDILLEGEGHIRVAWQPPGGYEDGIPVGQRTINRLPGDHATHGVLRENLNAPFGTTGLILPVDQQRFPDLEGKSIMTRGPDSTVHLMSVFRKVGADGDLSTSLDAHGDATRVRFKVDFNGAPFTSPFFDETLDDLDDLTEQLEEKTKDTHKLRCAYIAVNQPDLRSVTSHFLSNSDPIKGRKRWLIVPDGLRQAAIVQVTGHPRGAYYLFDVERRTDVEHYALVMGFNREGTTLPRQTLEAALKSCLERSGVWPYAGEVPDLETVRFSHAFDDIASLATEVLRAMDDPNIKEHTKKRRVVKR